MEKKLDVICEFTKEDEIIPMRIRVTDSDGEFHAYTIKGYKNLSGRGAYTTPDGVYVTNDILVFACKIEVWGKERVVRLYYHLSKSKWYMVC
ncbi:MAG: hypothetical protein K6G01_11190 [Eubacterium sp.]|nr:hypothetical protein [Eubacterium sp.]